MEAPEIANAVAIVLSAGGGMIVLKLIEHATAVFTGRAKSKRDEVDRAWAKAEQAEEARAHSERARDQERRDRRIAQEHTSELRRMLIEASCVDTADIPPYPSSGPETGPIPKEKS